MKILRVKQQDGTLVDIPFGVSNSSIEIATHNADTSAHTDIRDLIAELANRLNAIADSDDINLDQLSEIVAYIKSNKSLIESITTNKVNVSDIVNNLTTTDTNKPLSAAQGVALKALIDAIIIPTKVSDLTNDKGYLTSYTETDPTISAWAKEPTKPSYNKTEVGLGNVDNVKQYSADNPPPYPVISVNGKTGAVDLSASDVKALSLNGGEIDGGLTVSDKFVQGSPSNDSTIASMNRFNADLFVQGNGSAPNIPTVPGFYLGKSASDENRHMDIVSGADYAYIDFNKAGNNLDYDARILVNVNDGLVALMWDSTKTQKILNVHGAILQNGVPVPSKTETWTFTLENGSTVSKVVYVG